MALFQRLPIPNTEERRTVQRYRVDAPARFKTLGGVREGRLSDLSEAGARLETSGALKQGSSGLLAWGDYEFFGKVVWVKDNTCGIVFERPIPHSVVARTCEVVEVESGPVANFGNIPVAARGRRASLVSRDS